MNQNLVLILLFTIICKVSCNGIYNPSKKPKNTFTAIKMDLSALGVESEDFPSIHAFINLDKDTSQCEKSYYNPKIKSSTYKLSRTEISRIIDMINNYDLENLQRNYRTNKTDQPTSTAIFYQGQKNFIIKDYGLIGDSILQELYKIVYKL